jgi:hypothetical protein
MSKRNVDPDFDREAIERQDPLGEQGFEEDGFDDAPDGGPRLEAEGLVDDRREKPAGGGGQKVAGVPEAQQKLENSGSPDRPDTTDAVIRERGGASKGDPAVGGTRPD